MSSQSPRVPEDEVNDVPLSIRAAVALSEGARLISYLCDAPPKNRDDCLCGVGIGSGYLTAEGGQFTAWRGGKIDCIASEFDGELVITTPTKSRGVFLAEGMRAFIGPTILAPSKAQGEQN